MNESCKTYERTTSEHESMLRQSIGILHSEYAAMALEVPVGSFYHAGRFTTPGCRLVKGANNYRYFDVGGQTATYRQQKGTSVMKCGKRVDDLTRGLTPANRLKFEQVVKQECSQ